MDGTEDERARRRLVFTVRLPVQAAPLAVAPPAHRWRRCGCCWWKTTTRRARACSANAGLGVRAQRRGGVLEAAAATGVDASERASAEQVGQPFDVVLLDWGAARPGRRAGAAPGPATRGHARGRHVGVLGSRALRRRACSKPAPTAT
ncbi:MAG: hypothetical protein U1F25_19840 [Rubrivivax sp.]